MGTASVIKPNFGRYSAYCYCYCYCYCYYYLSFRPQCDGQHSLMVTGNVKTQKTTAGHYSVHSCLWPQIDGQHCFMVT